MTPQTSDPATRAIHATIRTISDSTVAKTALAILAMSVGGLMVGGATTASASNPPPPTCVTTAVQDGDSLHKIGERHGRTVEQMIADNPQLANPDSIWPGELVCISPMTILGMEIGAAVTLERANYATVEIPATSNGDFQPPLHIREAAWSAFGDLGIDVYVQSLTVARCEASYNESAHRTTSDAGLVIGDLGLYQINYIHIDWLIAAGVINTKMDLFDPSSNAIAARAIYDRAGGGWGDWYMSAKCHNKH